MADLKELDDLILDAESGCYEIAIFEVVDQNDRVGVTLETAVDHEVVTKAGQAIVDAAGSSLPRLVGLQIHIQARPMESDNAALAFFASLGTDEDSDPDMDLAHRITQVAMKVIIEGLLPEAKITQVHTLDRTMLN